jgi:hypothetical protein
MAMLSWGDMVGWSLLIFVLGNRVFMKVSCDLGTKDKIIYVIFSDEFVAYKQGYQNMCLD